MTDPTTDRPEPTRRPPRLRIMTLLLVVAGVALALGAYRFRQDNGGDDRSYNSLQLRNLRAPDPKTRRLAAESLGQARGDEAGRVLPALLISLRDADPGVRAASARGVSMQVQALAAARGGDVAAEQGEAASALVERLADRDADVRQSAARALSNLLLTDGPRPDPKVVVPPLVALLADPKAGVRIDATVALGRLAPEDADAPRPLLELASRTGFEPAVRAEAVRALARPWRNRDAVYVALVEALADPAEEVASAAGWTLPGLSPPPEAAGPALLRAFGAGNDWRRHQLAPCLGYTAPDATRLLPDLLRLVRLEIREHVSPDAAGAIVRIAPGSPEAARAVALVAEQAGAGADPSMRWMYLQYLGQLGPDARRALPTIRAATKDEDPGLRRLAADLLRAIAPRDEMIDYSGQK